MMLLHITVKPNSKVDQVLVQSDGSIRVKIKAPPIDGKANKYLIEYLAKVFGVSKAYLDIVKGETNPNKTIKINIDEKQALAILHKLK